MKTSLCIVSLAFAISSFAPAGEPELTTSLTEDVHATSGLWTSARPDGHAPIGVMADHTHHAGEWMLSYRYMFMQMDGNRRGNDTISDHDVYAAGYGVAPQSMEMHMNMFGLMFAPTDWLTLMAMTNYNRNEMTMKANPHAMHGSDHGGGGHTGTFGHESEGWGDTSLAALVRLFNAGNQSAHLGLGIGFPTAEIEAKQGGMYLPYGMQLGRGLWDLRPSLTYLGQRSAFSWGGQASGIIGLESENAAGYAPGNVFNTTGWMAVKINDFASLSTRLNYTHQEDWDGHFDGPHGHSSPPNFIENYGGDILEIGVGLNLYAPEGVLKGHRLAIEALFPVYQEANGIQMDRDYSIVAGWQFAF